MYFSRHAPPRLGRHLIGAEGRQRGHDLFKRCQTPLAIGPVSLGQTAFRQLAVALKYLLGRHQTTSDIRLSRCLMRVADLLCIPTGTLTIFTYKLGVDMTLNTGGTSYH